MTAFSCSYPLTLNAPTWATELQLKQQLVIWNPKIIYITKLSDRRLPPIAQIGMDRAGEISQTRAAPKQRVDFAADAEAWRVMLSARSIRGGSFQAIPLIISPSTMR
jgi:hypothetical protein